MTLPALLHPVTATDPLTQAGSMPSLPLGPSFPALAELPQVPFFRSDWQDLVHLQFQTSLAAMPWVHLWIAHLIQPSLHTGGHWSPLSPAPDQPTPIFLLSTPDTHQDQPVERLHQLTLPQALYPRLLGWAKGVRLQAGTVVLKPQPSGWILHVGDNLSLALPPTAPSSSLALQTKATLPGALPDHWLTLAGNTRRVFHMESAVRAEPWRELEVDPAACPDGGALHPLLKNARLQRAYGLANLPGVVLHRPVCVEGRGCLRTWQATHH